MRFEIGLDFVYVLLRLVRRPLWIRILKILESLTSSTSRFFFLLNFEVKNFFCLRTVRPSAIICVSVCIASYCQLQGYFCSLMFYQPLFISWLAAERLASMSVVCNCREKSFVYTRKVLTSESTLQFYSLDILRGCLAGIRSHPH